jgi:hypothetical protein
MAKAQLNGTTVDALVDCGSSFTVISERSAQVAGLLPQTSHKMVLHVLDGRRVSTCGIARADLRVAGVVLDGIDVHVVPTLPPGIHLVLGLDVIQRTGLLVKGQSKEPTLVFSNSGHSRPLQCLAPTVEAAHPPIEVDDADFVAKFDGKSWSIRWKWKENVEPANVRSPPNYKVSGEHQEAFDKELETWIDEGILVRHDVSLHGNVKAFIPMMAVWQPRKNKVRPVLDYRFINDSLESHTGSCTSACDESLRRCRCRGGNIRILDLRRAYLQIHVDPSLWVFQAVRYRGAVYLMTRVGFGLCSAPKIMHRIMITVLSSDADVAAATDNYYDDILVEESKVTVERVKAHLSSYGLETKESESLVGSKVLGLQIEVRRGALSWRRFGDPPPSPRTR